MKLPTAEMWEASFVHMLLVIFQTQIYMDLHRLNVVYITQFIYFNSHGSTPPTQHPANNEYPSSHSR
jgi:hypothetical protein